jgi:hypothetical protein
LLVVSVVLVSRALGNDSPTVSLVALVVGVLAGLVQALGLLRWVYLVPALARAHDEEDASDATRDAVGLSRFVRSTSTSGSALASTSAIS